MILRFTTKRDTNGNRKCLVIDTELKKAQRGYNFRYACDFIEIKKADRDRILKLLEIDGYTIENI